MTRQTCAKADSDGRHSASYDEEGWPGVSRDLPVISVILSLFFFAQNEKNW